MWVCARDIVGGGCGVFSAIVTARLILMLKFPRPGAVKTRLIPALGAERACELYCALVRHTLATAAELAEHTDIAIEVRLAGASDETAARAWLGDAVAIREQGGGDLGARMERATSAALAEGAVAVVVIGADCPQLTAAHLSAAFAALRDHDLVLGPAEDGGYYLIGLRRPQPALFSGIAWSTATVLAETLAAAQRAALSCHLLERLGDVDEPDDLAVWAETSAAQATGRDRVSVIIPVLNEAAHLPATLASIRRGDPHEVIVVDGGSADGTPELARTHGAIVLAAPPGRAAQMNRGAASATGERLLFLHADTLLPDGYAAHVRATLAQPGVVAGAFGFAIAENFFGRAWIERTTNARARRWQLPYGDQALFLRRETFRQAGGFREWPIMEDYEFVRRLRGQGKIAIAPAVVLTSGRRWRELGAARTTLLNQAIILGFHLGVPPARLAAWYRAGRPAASILAPPFDGTVSLRSLSSSPSTHDHTT